MTPGLVLDGVVAVLLVAMIIHCIALRRRIAGPRGGQDRFAKRIETFNAATARAG